MQKKVLFVFVILLLSMFQSGLASAQVSDLKSAVERVSYHAEQYEAGNIDYAKFIVETNEAQSEINAILNNKETTDQILTEALGTSEKVDKIEIEGQNSEVSLETPVSSWSDIAYDGNIIQVKREIVPIVIRQGSQETLTHKAEIEINFANDATNLDVSGKIDDIQTLAKTFNLDPNIQTANDVAREASNIQNLFDEYSKQSGIECPKMMAEIFGEENKKSDLEISVNQYEIYNDNGLKTVAEVQSCNNCEGQDAWKFIKVNYYLEQNGEKINRPFTSDSNEELFRDYEATAFKQEIINSERILNELLSAGNYKAAASVMERLEVMNEVWDEKSNNVWEEVKNLPNPKIAEANKRTENFLGRNQFFNSLFEGLPAETSYYEQQEYEKILTQVLNDGGEEICNNKIDDNANEKIDCSDDLCTGQICGEETITKTENNETKEEVRQLYCMAGTCKAKEDEAEVVGPVCGNKICEEGENDVCDDCRTCTIYPPIECSGNLIFSGEDANSCPLEPVCINEKTSSCTANADCIAPLCGGVECVAGECKTTSLEECKQTQCIDGEEKIIDCSSGDKIISEACSNGVWEKTNKECLSSEPAVNPNDNQGAGAASSSIDSVTSSNVNSGASESVSIVSNQKVCNSKRDCGGDNVCKEGQCVAVPINAKTKPSLTATTQEPITGIDFTGNAISISASGITGLLETSGIPPKDFEKPINADGGSSSPLTGVAREEKIAEIVNTFEKEKEEQAITFSPSFEDLLPQEKEVFAAKGICKTSRGKTESLLTFSGGGESFSAISSLQSKYQEGGAEWCNFELGNLLEQRNKIELSFNNDFAQWFFEEHLAKSADNWEQKEKPIEEIFWKVVENQMQIAKMMECSGIRELSQYNPIQINYASNFGSLEYLEAVEVVKLPGMTQEVMIITPNIKLRILPEKKFIVNELEKAMKTYSFMGSSETASERARLGGLTAQEKQLIFENDDLVNKINELSSNYKDGKTDLQISIQEGEEVIYNLYARISGEDIKAQPMPPEETPSTDVKITIPFSEVYDLLKKSMEHTYERKAPWNDGLNIAERAKSITNWISMWINTNNFMNSITVLPEKQSGDVKDLIKRIFFIIEENQNTNEIVDASVQKETSIWNSKGDVKRTIN